MILNCPEDIEDSAPVTEDGVLVVWTEPLATDNSGVTNLTKQTHHSGITFPVGKPK